MLGSQDTRRRLSTPVAVALISLLVLLVGGAYIVFFRGEWNPCVPLPEGETREECELFEAHRRFNHIIYSASPSSRSPVGAGLSNFDFNSHGINYRFFLDWVFYRHEIGAPLDAFDEFFMIQDAALNRRAFDWEEYAPPYDPERDPEVAAYVAWAVENYCIRSDPRCNPTTTTTSHDFRLALAEIYLAYRNSRESLPGEARVNFPEHPARLCTPHWSWELLAPLSPEAIVALVRAYSDPEYVLDMRGLLYRGDAWAHLDEIYENSLLQAGINPDSLPFFGDGHITRHFDGGCDRNLRPLLRSAYALDEPYIDVCEQQFSFLRNWLGAAALQDGRLLELVHPACPHPEFGDDS